ncbi:MAG: hypothetical protein WDA65_09535 [Christensenellales bacterium]
MTANNNVIMITYWANPNDLVDTNKGLIPKSQWHDNEVKRCNKNGRIVMKKITNFARRCSIGENIRTGGQN